MVKLLIIISFTQNLLFISCSNREQNLKNENYDIDVWVDPTVELVCTIHRLAETDQYTSNEYFTYISDVEDNFVSFQNHQAINLAIKQRRECRINGSAPMALAIYLKNPPELTPKNTLSPLPSDLDARWTEDNISEFIEAARVFSEDTEFMEFFNNHKGIYEQSRVNLINKIKNEDLLSWFENYFSYKPEGFTIIIGMQNGHGNYGMSITHKDSSKEYFAILGASASWWRKVPEFKNYWIIPTVVHEFCHSYVNPLIDDNYNELKVTAESIFRNEPPKSYFLPKIMLYEYLVRASTIRFFYAKNDYKTIERRISIDKEDGFPAIEGLVEILGEYEGNRDKYVSLLDFMPEITHYFITYSNSLKY